MTAIGKDHLKTRQLLQVGSQAYAYYSLDKAAASLGDVRRLPFSLKVLLENLLRFEDGARIKIDDIKAFVASALMRKPQGEVLFSPARVLMQDFTGVPAVVDLAAMRDAMAAQGKDPAKVNPMVPVDLVIDHSVIADYYGHKGALQENVAMEYQRNWERYAFLRWGQKAFRNFRVVPPGTGICHQVNLEYLAQVVWTSPDRDGVMVAYPDTLVGTDSHTTMVNGLSVLGWGVGGIEAEAVMLDQPMSMVAPEVIGFKFEGALPEGATATDLVLTVTNILRAKGVVGKFVEFFGPGLGQLSIEDRATVANMTPEFGATCGFFPIDAKTIDYLRFTGRDPGRIALVEAYAKTQGLWHDDHDPEPLYTEVLTLDLSGIRPTLAGPKRPQDKVLLENVRDSIQVQCPDMMTAHTVAEESYRLRHGDIVIAAITSCTNTSNPSVMLAAGLLARNARAKGLAPKPWVKTSLAPGSQIVTDYLAKSGLDKDLDALGFNLVGYGCTTCIGNSGPLNPPIAQTINENNLIVGAVLSGNRNFEARIHPQVKANYLASPPLVVAYALAGTLNIDLTKEPIGKNAQGQPVYLKDIWPSLSEINEAIRQFMTPEMFRIRYGDVFKGGEEWQKLKVVSTETYAWDPVSTYIKHPPYFQEFKSQPKPPRDIIEARLLALLGDSITTDHISPAGSIESQAAGSIECKSPAGQHLRDHGVDKAHFNSYGSRRGNHEVMTRGTFANIRIQNEMTPDRTGGYTRHWPTQDVLTIYEAAMRYQAEHRPLIVVAGKEYGTGSSRDWAAKGTSLLGVRAVIAESYERIHRSNLIGMGVLPLEFPTGMNRKTLRLTGAEIITIRGLEKGIRAKMAMDLEICYADGRKENLQFPCRIDTQDEVHYFNHGGILPYVLRSLLK